MQFINSVFASIQVPSTEYIYILYIYMYVFRYFNFYRTQTDINTYKETGNGVICKSSQKLTIGILKIQM